MKKAILLVLGLIVLSAITNAKNNDPLLLKPKANSSGTVFDLDSKLINVGVGIGHARVSYGLGSIYRSTPYFTASYEQAWPKKLGPGYLGVGAILGYRTAYARQNDYYYLGERYYYEHRWNYLMVATRGVYHWDVLNAKNAEVYGGVVLGFRISTYKYNTNSIDPDANYYRMNNSGFGAVGSLFAGARWYFVPNFALFAEAGLGISYLTAGITFKL